LQLRGDELLGVKGVVGHPASQGALCVKGRFGHSWVDHPDRLREPLVRKNGQLVEATWDEALDLVAEKLAASVGKFGAVASARCTNEENYVVQKFARAVMGTNNVDNSART
jgi:predicted molibdopterin-dependent oxidoreductase YjgC